MTKIAASVSSSPEASARRRRPAQSCSTTTASTGRTIRDVDVAMKRRLQTLFDGDITLAAYHLALDAHPEIGNNIIVSRELGIAEPERFLEWGSAASSSPPRWTSLRSAWSERLVGRSQVFDGGLEPIERLAVTGPAAPQGSSVRRPPPATTRS